MGDMYKMVEPWKKDSITPALSPCKLTMFLCIFIFHTPGVGIAAVQIAKALGAVVIGTVGADAKVDVVRRAGADHVLVYGSTQSKAAGSKGNGNP